MAKHICIDIGGTFTDAFVMDEQGNVKVFKALTTPQNYIKGIVDVLKIAAEYYNETLFDFLQSCSPPKGGILTHGSTIATNAILEKKAAKVGMIVTKGFRDVLLFREGPIKDPFDFQLDYPEPYIPRYLTLPVTERINSEGGVETLLNEAEVQQVVRQFKAWNVEAIAVCLLWSVLNPVHEKRIREIIKQEWPEIDVVLSSEVNPCIREYRRWVSAAMDASIRPLVSKYIREINNELKKLGFKGEIGMLNSTGCIVTTDELILRPLYAIDSGPALAPVAGKVYVEEEIKEQNLVVMDMGGTSFDVSCIRDGIIAVSRETKIGDEVPGISRVDIHSIGAGGGSIAWVDSGGMVHVGPHSAASTPGPACYGRGGTLPTVTDANLILGYIDPDFFAAGQLKLDRELAEKAIFEHVAAPLGLSVPEAAFTIWSTINANMIAAIEDITIWQGIDPREYVAVSGGGACGIHAIPLAEGLEMKRVLIPRTAGTLSAVGGIFSDMTSEYSRSFYIETRDLDFAEKVNEVLRFLVDEAVAFFERNSTPSEKRFLEFYLEGRYPYQVWEISIPLNGLLNEQNQINAQGANKLVQLFHEEHEKIFAVKEPNAYVECIFWRVKAIGKRDTAGHFELAEVTATSASADAKGTRKAYFRELGGFIDTPIYHGESLYFGNKIVGPAIIEESTSTVVVYPGYEVDVTKLNNYYISKLKDI